MEYQASITSARVFAGCVSVGVRRVCACRRRCGAKLGVRNRGAQCSDRFRKKAQARQCTLVSDEEANQARQRECAWCVHVCVCVYVYVCVCV